MHGCQRLTAAPPSFQTATRRQVRVGSVAEEEHERGVAHIVEHLAFNATEVRSATAGGPSLPSGTVHALGEAHTAAALLACGRLEPVQAVAS